MLARLLFAAVALCLIGALPDARAARTSSPRSGEPGLPAAHAALGLAAPRPEAAGASSAPAPGAPPAQGR